MKSWMLLVVCGLFAVAARSSETVVSEPEISEDDREHWSFMPIEPVLVPNVQETHWPRSEIDHFILADLERASLTPSPAADRRTLLRRLSFDLVGLPPTPAELDDFEQDKSPTAYLGQIERLLASPEYGRRWAQHWLDLARFAESDGFEHDVTRPEAWKYRDWVIDAFNDDLPYDRFVACQVAGDLLLDHPQPIATMFCLSGPDMPDVNDQTLRRHQLINELTATVGSVFLGLQFGCAQCHDHKYDPISQADFYRLRAVFEPSIPELKRDKPCTTLVSRIYDQPARLWLHGEVTQPGPPLLPAVPRIATPDGNYKAIGNDRDPRLDFVAALFDEGNPLTARVIVNRLWQHHFGVGIYDSPSDAGVMMAGPTHPELLDWLAGELRRSEWSLKHIHRLIVQSATYQQTSRQLADDPLWSQRLAMDPKNKRYSRFTRRRLEGEAVRDVMLSLAGTLTDCGGGPGALPPLPAEMRATLLKGQWNTSKSEAEHHRRSIYVFARRNLRYPIFDVFDRPDAGTSCARRDQSTTATQSLQLFNSEFSWKIATALAARIAPPPSDLQSNLPAAIEQLFLLTLSRRPAVDELDRLREFVEQTPASEHHPLTPVCLAILNSNEFLTID
jgi:hypothetical protein